MKSFGIKDFSIVKRVKGSDSSYVPGKISFSKKDGSEIAKAEGGDNHYGPEFVLEDDEEIIGVYGASADLDDAIYNLGFIVWKPPTI